MVELTGASLLLPKLSFFFGPFLTGMEKVGEETPQELFLDALPLPLFSFHNLLISH